VREKVLAAHRAGIKTIILPKRNLKDMVDVPKRARNDLTLVPVERMDEVIKVALRPAETNAKPRQT
jgi:ATP-dependent Lon protease